MSLDVPMVASIAATFISLISLLISGISLFYSRYDKRPRLNVSMSTEEVEYETDYEFGPPPPEEILFVDISNPGEKPVKVNNIVFEWNKTIGTYPDLQTEPAKKPPFRLVPGDNATYSTLADDFLYWLRYQGASGRTKIRANVIDALGNPYRSAWITIIIPSRKA